MIKVIRIIYKKMKINLFEHNEKITFMEDSTDENLIYSISDNKMDSITLDKSFTNIEDIINDLKSEEKPKLKRTKSLNDLIHLKKNTNYITNKKINEYIRIIVQNHYENIMNNDENLATDIIKLMLVTETDSIIGYLKRLINTVLNVPTPAQILREDSNAGRALKYFLSFAIGPIKIGKNIFKENPNKISKNDLKKKIEDIEKIILVKIRSIPSILKMLLNEFFMKAIYKFNGSINGYIALHSLLILRYFGQLIMNDVDHNQDIYVGKYWNIFIKETNPDKKDNFQSQIYSNDDKPIDFMLRIIKEMNEPDEFIDTPKIKLSKSYKMEIIERLKCEQKL